MRRSMPGSPRSPFKRWLKRLVLTVVFGTVLAAGLAVGSYFYFSRDLPSVEELKSYRPPQVSKVFCKDGALCAEFFRERRTWVDVTQLPPHVKNAFLAAEDAGFYSHQGLDFLGMLRAVVKALRPGSRAGGASTISQQACRNLLLNRDRTLARKIREIILTPRMEAALTKDQILNLYVNTVWFGHKRYGLEEASLFYFGKHAKDLGVGEAAVLAGTVQLPHRINPLTSVTKAKRRQTYVLKQAAKNGFITEAVADAEIQKAITLGPRPPPSVGAYYAEELRKQLVARYGEKAVLEGGLRIDTPMDVRLQGYAEASVRSGLEALDKRQGYRGPVGTIDLARWPTLRGLLEARLAEAGKRRNDEVLIADVDSLKSLTPAEEDPDVGRLEPEEIDGDEPIPSDDERLVRGVRLEPLTEGVEVVALVTQVNDAQGLALIDLVSREGRLSFASATWARRRSPQGALGPNPTKLSEVVLAGDLVRVRLGKPMNGNPKALEVTLAQRPVVQGALLAIDPKDRTVVAMVGGYDFALSAFNRATQAKRQPGSSFKPFLYGAALASGRYTPTSVVNDAPEAVRDPWTQKVWKPQNFERGGFEGPMTLRAALTKSKNTVSVRLIEALTPTVVIDFARQAGIKSELPDNLTLALGTGEVSMLEIANAYATLHSLGRSAEPVMLTRVMQPDGKVLEEHHASFEETLPPAAAFLTTSLMRSVVEEGTATAVRELNRPAAGKTGTAQEYRDAWFSGYTQELVVSAWAGFDDHSPLGPNETGGKAALPMWLGFMREAVKDLPSQEFPVPPGVVQVRIDPTTGLLAGKSVPGRPESYLEGTEPKAEAPPPGQVDPNDFLLHDGKRN